MSNCCFKCKNYIFKLWFLNLPDGRPSTGYCTVKSFTDDNPDYHLVRGDETCDSWEEKV